MFPAVRANAQASPSPQPGNVSQMQELDNPNRGLSLLLPESHHLPRSYGQQSFTFHMALDTQVPQTDTDDKTSFRAKRQQPDIMYKR